MAATETINENQILRTEIDNLFNVLIDYQYKFLDRFDYPETDKAARRAYAIVNDATHRLSELGRDLISEQRS